MRSSILFIAAIVMTGCSGQDSDLRATLLEAINNGGPIDPSDIKPHNWDRICILPPYSTDEAAGTVLGFHWDIERRTGIEARDGCYIVALIRNHTVVSYAEMPRGDRELIRSDCTCFPKQAGPIAWHADVGWTQKDAIDG